MNFDRTLIPATLVTRYKRFLADVTLEDGSQVTAHCANPGAMSGLNQPGIRVWLEPNDDPRRKLNFSWKLVALAGGHFAGIDTSIPNKVIKEALSKRAIPEFADYSSVRAEVKYGKNSRIDFLLQQAGLPDLYLEVKSVTLKRATGWAEFPDSVTKRGSKHLAELSEMVKSGHRAVMLYLVQRTDCSKFRLATDIDPAYASAYDHARTQGVETLCYSTTITPRKIVLSNPLPIMQ